MDYNDIKNGFVELKTRRLEPEYIKLEYLDLLYNIKRAMCIIGIKNDDAFSVERHSFICAIIARTLYPILMRDFEYWELYYPDEDMHVTIDEFTVQCLFHDIAETVTGDIPSPIKNDLNKEFEDIIFKEIDKTLKIPSNFDKKTKAVKLVDLLSFLYELNCYGKNNYKIGDVRGYILTCIYDLINNLNSFSEIEDYLDRFILGVI